MIRVGQFCLVILILVSASLGAQEITLKKSFWSGWKYSENGVNFEKVGISAKGLKAVMSENERATAKMKSYSNNQLAAEIFGGVSGGLIGWWLGGEIGGKEDNSPDLAYAGLVLLVPAFFFESLATKNLKTAVEEFNGQGTRLSLNLRTIPTGNRNRVALGMLVSYKF